MKIIGSTSSQKLFISDCITLYIHFIFYTSITRILWRSRDHELRRRHLLKNCSYLIVSKCIMNNFYFVFPSLESVVSVYLLRVSVDLVDLCGDHKIMNSRARYNERQRQRGNFRHVCRDRANNAWFTSLRDDWRCKYFCKIYTMTR